MTDKTLLNYKKEKKRIYDKIYRSKNKEKIVASQKIYYAKNKEKHKKQMKIWRNNNKEKVRAQSKVYNAGRAKEQAIYMKAYWSSHLEEGRVNCRKRKALKLNNEHVKYRDIDILNRDCWVCQICGRKINKKLKWPDPYSKSIDHIVPLSKGGADAPVNLQATHLRCNMGKNNKCGGQLRLIG